MKKMNKKINNGVFYVVISLVAVLAIGGIIKAYSGNAPEIVIEGNYIEAQSTADETLGAAAGPNFYQPIRFVQGLTDSIWATSTVSTAEILTEADLEKYNIWEITPNTGSLTYTLPATSTLSTLLKNTGDSQTWILQNATTTTATTLTLAAGTGWNLSGVDANVDVIAGAAYTARVSQYIKCYRQTNTDIHCNIQEAIAAD